MPRLNFDIKESQFAWLMRQSCREFGKPVYEKIDNETRRWSFGGYKISLWKHAPIARDLPCHGVTASIHKDVACPYCCTKEAEVSQ